MGKIVFTITIIFNHLVRSHRNSIRWLYLTKLISISFNRSRSTTRHHHTSADKPKKKRHISATNSFASIPSAIKLSMLNSGLLPTSRFNGELVFAVYHKVPFIICFPSLTLEQCLCFRSPKVKA
nr:unnamed protein product [Callosobruchus analis]